MPEEEELSLNAFDHRHILKVGRAYGARTYAEIDADKFRERWWANFDLLAYNTFVLMCIGTMFLLGLMLHPIFFAPCAVSLVPWLISMLGRRPAGQPDVP